MKSLNKDCHIHMSRNQFTKGACLIWVVSWICVLSGAEDLTVKAYVDQTVVGLHQQFTLHIELSGREANSVSNPELPDLGAFAAFLGNSSSQNIQFVNGRMSVSKTLSYHFQATAVGKFQIAPVVIASGGKTYQTDPIAVEIVPSSTAPQPAPNQDIPVQGTGPAEGDLFLRATVDKKQVYQNEPVVVTYRIYTRVNVSSFGYSKVPTTGGFWVEEYPIAQQPQTSTEILEGKRYTVATIKKMALFPMAPGVKTIDPLEIECEVRVERRSRDIFDDFFSDPFGRTVRQAIQSRPIRVHVLPLPEEGKPEDFSGVVGQFRISSEVDKSSATTNEAVSFKIKIQGQGNIRTLPEPKVVFPKDFETYPPKITEDIQREGATISGSKTYEYVLVPRVSGRQKIKPVRLSFFDPSAKTYQTVRTNEIAMDIAKGAETFIAAPSGLSKEEVKLLGKDIYFIKTGNPSFQKIGVSVFNAYFFWILLIGPILCLAAAVGYRKHLDRLQGDVAYARNRRAGRSARKRLSAAKSMCHVSRQKEFYAEIGKALMGYLGDKLNIAEAGMITENVQKLLRERGVKEEAVANYLDCANTCDLKRFSPAGADLNEMKDFLKRAENAIVELDRQISRSF